MTPRQRQEFERLQLRNKLLEQRNIELARAAADKPESQALPRCPKGARNLLHWLSSLEPGHTRISKSDARSAALLLRWIDRVTLGK